MLDQWVPLSPVSPTPGAADGPPRRRARPRGRAALGQARRPHRTGRRRQQGAQARVPVRRRARAGVRRARHRRRPPVEPRPDDGGGRQPPRARLHDRARLGSGRRRHRQRRARPAPRARRSCGPDRSTTTRSRRPSTPRPTASAPRGRRPYAMPLGGASTIGQLGYVRAALGAARAAPRHHAHRHRRRHRRHPRRPGGGLGRPRRRARRRRRHPTRPRRGGATGGGRGGRPRRAARAGGHLRDRPRPLRRRLRRSDRELSRGARPVRSPRGAAARSRLLGQGHGRARSPPSGRTACLADGTIVFLHTGGLPALLTPRYTDWVAEWP